MSASSHYAQFIAHRMFKVAAPAERLPKTRQQEFKCVGEAWTLCTGGWEIHTCVKSHLLK